MLRVGSGFQDLGLSAFRGWGLRFRVQDVGLSASRVQDLGLSAFRVQDVGHSACRV